MQMLTTLSPDFSRGLTSFAVALDELAYAHCFLQNKIV